MVDNGARAGESRMRPVPTHLIGVGPASEFASARQLTGFPVAWAHSTESLATLQDALPPDPFILLLDGDLPADDLIALLVQYVGLVTVRPVILQISNPPVRHVVTIMKCGVRDVLAKPYTVERLKSAIQEILKQPGRL